MKFLVMAMQMVVALAVGSLGIYLGEKNGYLIGAWAFMASYGATQAAIWIVERRQRHHRPERL